MAIRARNQRQGGEDRAGTPPPRQRRPAGAPSAAAERDLLAAVLDAAEGPSLEDHLPRIAAALARYSRCECSGMVLFDETGITACTSVDGRTAQLRRASRDSVAVPAAAICQAIMGRGTGGPPSGPGGTGSFVRHRRPEDAGAANASPGPIGDCLGPAFFESVALIPITSGPAALGFMFLADARPGWIAPPVPAFLARLGARIGRAAPSPGSPRDPSIMPGTAGGTEALPVRPDELELAVRLVNNSTDAIMVSQDWRIIYVNQRCVDLLERPREDLIGMAFLDLSLPDDRAAIIERYSRILTGEVLPSGMVLRGIDKHGRLRWTGIREISFSWNGRPAVIHMVSDITNRIEAEEALRRSEERYRLLVETAGEVPAVVQDGVLKFISPRIEELSGYRVIEIIERPFEDFVHPDDRPAVAGYAAELLRGEVRYRSEQFRLVAKDGRILWVQTNAVLFEWEGRPAILAILGDITQWHAANEALKTSEGRFRALLENARDAFTVMDENFRIVYESPSLATVTGHSPEEWLGRSFADMELHPDDMPRLLSRVKVLSANPGMTVHDVIARYRHGDGTWHYLEVSSQNLLEDPRVRGLVFNYRDITARRRVEEALEESEHRYRLLAENASDVIFTADLDLKLLYVSPSVSQLTGYTPAEVVAMSPGEWLSAASRDFVLTTFPLVLARAQQGMDISRAMRTVTLELARKGGGTIWAEVRIDFVRDAAGRVTSLTGVGRDMTDHRQAEMERERRLQMDLLATEISTRFISLPIEAMDAGIRFALASIARFTEADHCCLFTITPDGSAMSLEQEWCSERSVPLAGRLDTVPVAAVPWLASQIRQSQSVQVPRPADLPADSEEERALFRSHGLESAVVVPMSQAGNATGFLALGSADAGRAWDAETMASLRLLAQMFSNALERRQIDLALRESERRYRLLAENITDVIWTTDLAPVITYMSPSATRLTGYSPEELEGVTLADMLTPDSLEKGLRVMAQRQSQETAQPGSESGYWTIEVELRRKEGSTFWAEEQVTFMRDHNGTPTGLIGVTRDITQRRLMEDALRLSESRYRTLVEVSPDAVLTMDAKGTITDCNAGLCRMLGYEKEALMGRQARDLRAQEGPLAPPDYRKRLANGEILEVETEIVRRDGQVLPVWGKLVGQAAAGTPDFQTVIYLRDIADRRKVDEMKDEFIGMVSHELRSPLTVIIGALHTAVEERPRLSQKEIDQLLRDATLEAEELSHLVVNLLELSRAQANRLFLHLEPVNLAKTVHRVVDSIERRSPGRRFAVDLPARMAPVAADQLRLERILHNLLENAVKYSPKDSEIAVSARREGGHLVVSVVDHGPGISREDQAKLFKPFQQLGDPIRDHTKGAGVGLLVCRRLVEAHGGRIWVESEPGQGATFRFTIADSANRQTGAPQERPEPPRPGAARDG